MSEDNVVHLKTNTKLDVPVERVLEGAKRYDFQRVIVLGVQQDGSLLIFLSSGDVGGNNLVLDCAKVQIVDREVINRPMEPVPPKDNV